MRCVPCSVIALDRPLVRMATDWRDDTVDHDEITLLLHPERLLPRVLEEELKTSTTKGPKGR